MKTVADGGGRLLEAMVFGDGTKCPKTAVSGRYRLLAVIMLLEKGNV